MQYWETGKDKESTLINSENREMVRWVLNYTYPMKFPVYDTQITLSKESIDDAMFWCTRPSNWDDIILPNATTYGNYKTEWSWDTKYRNQLA